MTHVARMLDRGAGLAALAPQQPGLVLRGCLTWPARLWLELPVSWTMLIAYAGAQRALITTSASDFAESTRRRWPVAAGDAWLALASAAQYGQAALAVEQWLTADDWSPDPWRLRRQSLVACIGASPGFPLANITTGGVLAHFGCELIDVDPVLRLER